MDDSRAAKVRSSLSKLCTIGVSSVGREVLVSRLVALWSNTDSSWDSPYRALGEGTKSKGINSGRGVWGLRIEIRSTKQCVVVGAAGRVPQ